MDLDLDPRLVLLAALSVDVFKEKVVLLQRLLQILSADTLARASLPLPRAHIHHLIRQGCLQIQVPRLM